jgi:hypothetical protein
VWLRAARHLLLVQQLAEFGDVGIQAGGAVGLPVAVTMDSGPLVLTNIDGVERPLFLAFNDDGLL